RRVPVLRQAAATPLRKAALDKVVIGSGLYVVHAVQLINPRVLPLFQLINDLFRSADDLLRLGAVVRQVAKGWVASRGRGKRRFQHALGAFGLHIPQRGIQIQSTQIHSDASTDVGDDGVRIQVLVVFSFKGLGFSFRGTDHEGQSGEDLDVF